MNVSVIIMVANNEKTIKKALEGLREFDEVIIYDTGSNDSTLKIAEKFVNTKIFSGDFKGFGLARNTATSLARNDWVLHIDSDEYVAEELAQEIKKLEVPDETVFLIRRRNYFMGKLIKHSGWNPDWIVRLYNRKKHSYSNAEVHESVQKKEYTQEKRLKAFLFHRAVPDIEQLIKKINLYSGIKRDNQRPVSPFAAFIMASLTFIKIYVLKRGFLDGWRGLVIAVSISNELFYRYMKAYSKEHVSKDVI